MHFQSSRRRQRRQASNNANPALPLEAEEEARVSSDMVQQKVLNDAEMSPVEQEVVRNEVLTFMRDHNAAEDPEYYPYGILSLTYRDADGRPTRRQAKYWQVVAANHLLRKDAGKLFTERQASLLLAHEMGTGKTITAILALAGVYRQMCWWRSSVAKRNPTTGQIDAPLEKKTVIMVPTGVLLKWEAEMRAWTTLGDRLLVTNRVEELTEQAIEAALVIIVTPEALTNAYKTFVYDKENPNEALEDEGDDDGTKKKRKAKQSKTWMRERVVRKVTAEGKQVPAHPFFQMLHRYGGLAMFIVDEVHLMYNPATWKGYISNELARRARYRLALSGTPITNGPWQLAFLARALDFRVPGVPLERIGEMQYPEFYHEGRVVNRESFEKWNRYLVDRVDARFLHDQITVQKKLTVIKYDPFVGHVKRDGTVDEEAIAEHNRRVREIKNIVREPGDFSKKVKLKNGDEFTATIALGQYEFNAPLGKEGASKFKTKKKASSKTETWDEDKIGEAANSPSQVMRLILRLIQSRQAAGHARVAVYCEQVAELKILYRYFEDLGSTVGEMYLYKGGQTPQEKERKIKKFMASPKGVFFYSAAGGVGIDLQKGCEVLLSVGSVPWTPSDLDQAYARVYRIGQTKDVEIIQLVARRGVSEVIMSLHGDKRRLAAAAIDGDFEIFAGQDVEWRAQATIMSQCVTLDSSGNYVLTDAQQNRLRDYTAMAAESAAAGGPPPPSAGLSVPPQAAVPPSRMRLPPVAFPLSVA